MTSKKFFQTWHRFEYWRQVYDKDTATAFREFYVDIYVNSGCDGQALNEYLNLIDICSSSNETLPDLNINTIENCIKNLKLSKSAEADNVIAEHIVYLLSQCCNSFNIFI